MLFLLLTNKLLQYSHIKYIIPNCLDTKAKFKTYHFSTKQVAIYKKVLYFLL